MSSIHILRESDFAKYPPQAKQLANDHLALLQQLPPAYAVVLLREMISYDWRFPAERDEIDVQLRFLSGMTAEKLKATMAGFAGLTLPPSFEDARWGAAPVEFTEKLTADLWQLHQMDRFREVADSFQSELRGQIPEVKPAIARLCIVVVGKGSAPEQTEIFQKLRPHGTYFSRVKPAGGLEGLFAVVNERAASYPISYGHWYVDGDTTDAAASAKLTPVSYAALRPVREALLREVDTAKSTGSVVGPEDLRSLLAGLKPDQLMPKDASQDAVLRHFELSLLTEGSGTQIFSTTFVQWAAREILRRARPLTLMIRFAPRQMQRPMNEMLLASDKIEKPDLAGSLIDADMGAYYTWINLMRLSGAESSLFIVWFEDQQEAVVIAPTMAKGAVSTTPCDFSQIVRWVS